MKHFAMAAIAAAGIAAAGAAHASTNLITNGSFESGGFTGWSYTGVVPDGFSASIITYNNHDPYPNGAFGELIPPDNSANPSPDPVGQHAAYFVGDGATESLSQTVHLLPGVYTIGFSVYVPLNGYQNAGDATFDGTIAGVNLAHFNAHGATPQTWVHYAGLAHILAEGDYVSTFGYHSGSAPAADFVVDRAYIVAGNAIPEPATWALMLLGFGATGALLRSRRTRLA